MKTPRHAPPVVRDGKTLLPAHAVSTAPVTAFGLIGGYLTARETGIRPLGGVVLAAAGLYAGRTWLAKRGPAVAGGLAALYLGGFGASHPLASHVRPAYRPAAASTTPPSGRMPVSRAVR